jgi:hypothetical protein
MLMLI